jgi:hypothetical protein
MMACGAQTGACWTMGVAVYAFLVGRLNDDIARR